MPAPTDLDADAHVLLAGVPISACAQGWSPDSRSPRGGVAFELVATELVVTGTLFIDAIILI